MKQQTQSSFKSKGPDHQIRLTPVTGSSVSASGPWFPLTFLYAASILLALQVNSSCGCWCSDAGQEFGSAAPVFKACPVTTEGHVTLLTHTHTHTHTPLLSVCHGMVVVKQNYNGTSGSCCPPLLGLTLPPGALGRLSAVVASLPAAVAAAMVPVCVSAAWLTCGQVKVQLQPT